MCSDVREAWSHSESVAGWLDSQEQLQSVRHCLRQQCGSTLSSSQQFAGNYQSWGHDTAGPSKMSFFGQFFMYLLKK